MSQVYLIVTHKQPEQLALLIEQLQSSSSFFFIHVDKKSSVDDFIHHTTKCKNINFLRKRYNLDWGGFGIIRASIALMRELKLSGIDYSHAHILSGEDIALYPPEHIEKYFSGNPGKNYLSYNKLPYNRWKNGGMDRISRYYFGQYNRNASKNKIRMLRKVDYILNNLLTKHLPLLKKQTNVYNTFYGGSGWWSLNKQTVEWLLKYFDNHPKNLSFFKTVYIPFECTFHSILMNSELKDSVCKDNKRYIDWSRSRRGSPTVLDESDYEVLKDSNCFFARKIDYEKGKCLYKIILNKDHYII